MLASDHAISQLAAPALDVRVLARRVGPAAVLAGAAVAALLLAGGRVHAFTAALHRALGAGAGWALLGAALECASLAGYVALLSLVAGRAVPRVRPRESAQIALAGAAATRLLPTAGAGGLALMLWTLRRAGARPVVAVRTALVFLVLLYSVFLAAIALCGAALTLGLVGSRAPAALGAIPAGAALLAILMCLLLASRRRDEADSDQLEVRHEGGGTRRQRLTAGARLFGAAVRDATRMLRAGDPRLVGAIAYWAFDAAVLWAMLRAFGAAPVLPVIALAYFLGQVANTVPLPGSVSGGMAAVLIASGVPAELAVPAVLAYRALAVWLPTPAAIAAVPALRATIARWGREDGKPAVGESSTAARVLRSAYESPRHALARSR